MKSKYLVLVACLSLSMMAAAQSTIERIEATPVNVSNLKNLTVSPMYQEWLARYQQVGDAINAVSDQYQLEVNKYGYPKKKTIQKKIELVTQYITLLKQQRDSDELNQNLDVKKVENKIIMWEEQLNGLNYLLKKIY
ncbi:hypothetical protein [Prevotella ihumii]|uniref:hypothetical protein n=1 Tax=Prevotella ihumii TaxID=1917878 RepID=UPI000981E194|nr:hypothetical protein [Prevotella ihumii]